MEIQTLAPLQPLSGETERRLRRYAAALLAMNEKVRLVGPRDMETLWKSHIVDCLHLLPLLPPSGSVIDVGTGGGLPGAVLAICRPDLKFTLLDSLSRKVNALASLLKDLEVVNAETVCLRSEDLAAQRRESYDFAAVRAVSDAGVIAEYLSPLVKVGGTAAAMKGSAVEDELAPLARKWGKLGLSEPRLCRYDLNGHDSYVVLWRKEAPCPPEFPRRPGRAEKKGWWK
ncbi:MAG: 16S rRNA (guanine(527)-N(7))-methyltransferase RsmG [Pyramidobacter sp.]|jgi:16S rRNA (guanine527-N7)-methyltransferase